MKKHFWFGGQRSFALACFAILFSSMLVPAAHAQSSRLIIHRAASFGSDAWLRIWIDGKEADALAWGHDFDQPISPGRHVIGVLDSDNRADRHPTNTVVELSAGQTHEFTAVRQHKGVALLKTRR